MAVQGVRVPSHGAVEVVKLQPIWVAHWLDEPLSALQGVTVPVQVVLAQEQSASRQVVSFVICAHVDGVPEHAPIPESPFFHLQPAAEHVLIEP